LLAKFIDNDDRRSGIDRRKFSYAVYIPERRSNKDRRKGSDEHSQQREKYNIIKSCNDFMKRELAAQLGERLKFLLKKHP
jgi:hypothetical protein